MSVVFRIFLLLIVVAISFIDLLLVYLLFVLDCDCKYVLFV